MVETSVAVATPPPTALRIRNGSTSAGAATSASYAVSGLIDWGLFAALVIGGAGGAMLGAPVSRWFAQRIAVAHEQGFQFWMGCEQPRVDKRSRVTVRGTINSTANTALRLEFFSAPTGDASGHGERALERSIAPLDKTVILLLLVRFELLLTTNDQQAVSNTDLDVLLVHTGQFCRDLDGRVGLDHLQARDKILIVEERRPRSGKDCRPGSEPVESIEHALDLLLKRFERIASS